MDARSRIDCIFFLGLVVRCAILDLVEETDCGNWFSLGSNELQYGEQRSLLDGRKIYG